MAAPSDRSVSNWIGARTRTMNNLTECQAKMAAAVLDEQFQTHDAINKLVGELEAKCRSYHTAHERITDNASPEQLATDDRGAAIAAEHEHLMDTQDNALAILFEARQRLIQSSETDRIAHAQQAADRQADLDKQSKITSLILTINNLYVKQSEVRIRFKETALRARNYQELAALQPIIASLESRLKIAEQKKNELIAMKADELLGRNQEFVDQQLGLREDLTQAMQDIRPAVLESDHVEALYHIFPTLRPSPAATPRGDDDVEGIRRGASAGSGPSETDWLRLAETMGRTMAASNKISTVKKLDPPRFSGQVQDFARWKKNWCSHMDETKYSDVQKIRYLTEAIPSKEKILVNRLSNCKDLVSCWTILKQEYDDADLLKNRMERLSSYAVPKSIKSNLNKFKHQISIWQEVRSDLTTVYLEHLMEHPITFEAFTAHLERETHLRWLEYKRKQRVIYPGKPIGKLFDEWILLELPILKEHDLVDPNKEVPKKDRDDKGDPGTCFGCGEAGHRKRECPKENPDRDKTCRNCSKKGHVFKNCRGPGGGNAGGKPGGGRGRPPGASHAGAAIKTTCPRCGEEHQWTNYKKETRPSTRLGSCPAFKADSVDTRADLLEKVKGCQKCLDFTGMHQHENCKFNGSCGVCNKKHNAALHGARNPYVNCANLAFSDSDENDVATEDTSHTLVPTRGLLCLESQVDVTTQPEMPINNSGEAVVLDEFKSDECAQKATDKTVSPPSSPKPSSKWIKTDLEFLDHKTEAKIPIEGEDSKRKRTSKHHASDLKTENEAEESKVKVETENPGKHNCNHSQETFHPHRMSEAVVTAPFASPWRKQPPTEAEIRQNEVEAQNTLFLAETVDYLSSDDDVVDGNNFYDNGSNIAYCTHEFANQLELASTPRSLSVLHTGKEIRQLQTKAYKLSQLFQDGSTRNYLCFGVNAISGDLHDADFSQIKTLFPDLDISKLHRPKGKIDVLLPSTFLSIFPTEVAKNGGARLYESVVKPGRFMVSGCHPVIHVDEGDFLSEDVRENRNVQILPSIYQNNASISLPEQDFWIGEEMGIDRPPRCSRCRSCSRCKTENQNISRKDAIDLEQIRDNMKLIPDPARPGYGHIEFNYPEAKPLELLQDNEGQARGFQAKIESSMDDEMRTKYNDEFFGFVDANTFVELTTEEMKDWDGPINYIVHHPVIKPQSVSTKVRVVSNSSLKNGKTGISVNDCWVKGPNSLRPIIECQVGFRSLKEVAVYDLTKAYNTVVTKPRQKHTRRMYWRRSKQEPWRVFAIQKMHFGDRPSACGLENAIDLVAEAGKEIDEEVARQARLGYVDDNFVGGTKETVDRAVGEEIVCPDGSLEYDGTIRKIHDLGGFKMKCIVRNGESRTEVIDKYGTHVLGLRWSPQDDKILASLPVNLHTRDRRTKLRAGPEVTMKTIHTIREKMLTRRILLSVFAAIYDILGFLCPITLKLKLYMQKLVMINLEWDEDLWQDLLLEGYVLLEMMVRAGQIPFPRSFLGEFWEEGYEIIGFFDGADAGSSGVLYARTPIYDPCLGAVVAKDSQPTGYDVRFIMAKARVTPDKRKEGQRRKSTPRTEMRGLQILARMITTVLQGVRYAPQTVHNFGDSQTIISTMDNVDRTLTEWYSNRVDEIAEHMTKWQELGVKVPALHHWPTEINPADLATRGTATLEDVQPGSIWQNGPAALQLPYDKWPITRDFCRVSVDQFVEHAGIVINLLNKEKLPNTMKGALGHLGATDWLKFIEMILEIIRRKSRLNVIIGTVARIIYRKNDPNKADEARKFAPTAEQWRMAEDCVFMAATSLTDPKHFRRFDPEMIGGVLVTSGARLGARSLLELVGQTKMPLLAYDNPLSAVIMWESHIVDHFLTDSTLAKSRETVWIASGRKLAEKITKGCIVCRIEYGKSIEQRMGRHPEATVMLYAQIWARVHVDLLGPFLCKAMNNARSDLKCYPMLITDEASGAVHTELIPAASTEAFKNEWLKFVDLRGRPHTVVSDFASNFRSKDNTVAVKKGLDDPANWDLTDVEISEARKKTTWIFNPPYAKWRNSRAERRIKTLKRILSAVLAAKLNPQLKLEYNFTQLQGILRHVANIINDRPIDLRSVTDDILAPVTVNHLLLGRNRNAPAPDIEFTEETEHYQMQHLFVSDIEKTWWRKWKEQAISTLMPFHSVKSMRKSANLEKGYVVMLMFESKLAATYRLAKVAVAEPSENDGCVRTVKLEFLPNNVLTKARAYKHEDYDSRDYAVQSLVLVITREEIEQRFQQSESDEAHLDSLVHPHVLARQAHPATNCNVDNTRTVNSPNDCATAGEKSKIEKKVTFSLSTRQPDDDIEGDEPGRVGWSGPVPRPLPKV